MFGKQKPPSKPMQFSAPCSPSVFDAAVTVLRKQGQTVAMSAPGPGGAVTGEVSGSEFGIKVRTTFTYNPPNRLLTVAVLDGPGDLVKSRMLGELRRIEKELESQSSQSQSTNPPAA